MNYWASSSFTVVANIKLATPSVGREPPRVQVAPPVTDPSFSGPSAFISGYPRTVVSWVSLLLPLCFSLPPQVQHEVRSFEKLLAFWQR